MFVADLPQPDLYDERSWMLHNPRRMHILRVRETHALVPIARNPPYASDAPDPTKQDGVAPISKWQIRWQSLNLVCSRKQYYL